MSAEVGEIAQAPDAARAALLLPLRGVLDEADRLALPAHDLVAGVDALRRADALGLEAAPDVGPGRARVDAGPARDAVAGEDADQPVLQPHLRVAALLVVRHQDGVLIGQHVLQAAVGARDRAHLVAEPAEVEEDGARDERDHGQRPGPRARIGGERRGGAAPIP